MVAVVLIAFPTTGLRSHRHHQHHDPCVPGQQERYETPVPPRSNAVKTRFQDIRPADIQVPGLRADIASQPHPKTNEDFLGSMSPPS